MCTRKKENGVWGKFSTPAVWAKFGKDGAKGDSVTHMGDWEEDKKVPYLGIVRIANASYICTNKDGTICSYMVLTDESGNDLTDENDYDLLSDEIDLTDFVLMAEDGKDGEDGTDLEYIYTLISGNNRPGTPDNNQQDDYVPAGWTDNPQGISEAYMYEWVSIRHKDKGQWSAFSKPAIWAKWGETGKDGDGVEYIFRRTPTYINPAKPPSSTQDGYVPVNWTNNPTGVTETLPFEWVSQRKKKAGVWGDFSAPAVWAKYSKDGQDGQPGQKGEDGDGVTHVGYWQEDKYVPYLGVVRIDDASWMCINKNGTTCAYMVLTDELGNDLTDENGYDLLSDEIDLTDFVLMAEDGVGVTSIVEHYYLSSSPTTLTGGSWTTTRPTWTNGWYIWTRKVITYTNGGTTTTEPICVTGGVGTEGRQGIQGCVIRKAEWRLEVEWRNDEALVNGTRYLDIALVRDTTLETGWQAYKCLETHTSKADNAPGNKKYWEPFGLNVNAIFTSLIIAKDASIDFMQGNQLLIKKEDGTVTAGLSGSQSGGKIRIWAGGDNPETANFRVNENGDGKYSGEIEATTGLIGGFQIGAGRIGVENGAGGAAKGLLIYNNMIGFNGDGMQAIIGTYNNMGYDRLGQFSNTRARTIPNNGISLAVRNGGIGGGQNEALQLGGGYISGFAVKPEVISVSKTISRDINVAVCTNTQEITVTLPLCYEYDNGKVLWIKNLGGGKVNIKPSSINQAIHHDRGSYATPSSPDDLVSIGDASSYVFIWGLKRVGTSETGMWVQFKNPRDW